MLKSSWKLESPKIKQSDASQENSLYPDESSSPFRSKEKRVRIQTSLGQKPRLVPSISAKSLTKLKSPLRLSYTLPKSANRKSSGTLTPKRSLENGTAGISSPTYSSSRATTELNNTAPEPSIDHDTEPNNTKESINLESNVQDDVETFKTANLESDHKSRKIADSTDQDSLVNIPESPLTDRAQPTDLEELVQESPEKNYIIRNVNDRKIELDSSKTQDFRQIHYSLWTIPQVGLWIDQLNLSPQYGSQFIKHKVNGKKLDLITEDVLDKLGIEIWGDRIDIIEALDVLKKTHSILSD